MMCCSINEYRSGIGLFAQNTKLKTNNSNTYTNTANKHKAKYTTILLLLFILMPIHPNTSYTMHKKHNKIQHTLNGNHYLSLVHWNKGKSLFQNKTNHIDHILSIHRPHIFSPCETNVEKIINNTPNINYLDYNLEHKKMSSTTNRSRNIILIKNDIIYKRRYDLEDGLTSTIW